MTSVADDLVALRTLLILRGRGVGKWVDADGRVCLLQAIAHVVRGNELAAFRARA